MNTPGEDDLTPPAFPDVDPPSFPSAGGVSGQIALPDWLFNAELPDDPRIDTGTAAEPNTPLPMDELPVPTMEGLPIPSTDDPDATPEPQLVSTDIPASQFDAPDFGDMPTKIDPPSLNEIAAPITVSDPPKPKPKPLSLASLPLSYGLVAKINLPRTANGFRVEHQLPPGVKVLEVSPPTMIVSNVVVWEFGRMESGQDLRLSLVVAPLSNAKLKAGDLTSFSVTYTQNLTFQTPLVRPRLTPRFDGPTDLEVGRSATYSLNVMNTGNWPVTNVEAVVNIPDGLVHTAGSRLTHQIDRLLPGESRSLSMGLKAIRSGQSTLVAMISGSDRIQETSEYAIQVTQSHLNLRLSGPEDWLVDEPANIRVLVRNVGDAPARQLHIQVAIPDTFTVDRTDGVYQPETGMVRWEMADMIANGSRSFELRVTPTKPVETTILAEAIAEHQTVSAELVAPVKLSMNRRSTILDELFDASPLPAITGYQPTVSRAKSTDQQFIVFTLDQTEYAVPLDRVLEVSRPPVWTPLPNVPEWLLGVANVRGEIVSIVNLRTFFGQADHVVGINSRIMVLRTADNQLSTAMLVDRIRGLRQLPKDRITQPTAPIHAGVIPYMRGIIEHDGRLIVLIDVERLLTSPALKQFEPETVNEF